MARGGHTSERIRCGEGVSDRRPSEGDGVGCTVGRWCIVLDDGRAVLAETSWRNLALAAVALIAR